MSAVVQVESFPSPFWREASFAVIDTDGCAFAKAMPVELLVAALYWGRSRTSSPRPSDAADLVQDVFVTLVQELPGFRFDPGKSFRRWLNTVTLNRWRAWERRAAPASLDHQPEPQVCDPAEAFWEEEYRGWLTGRALQVMQAEFEPHVWRACWLTAAEGRPAAEVPQSWA